MPPVYQMDANILLRFLRDDHREYSRKAQTLIARANAGELLLDVSAVTVAEVFYALKAAYQIDRRTAAGTLAGVLNTPAFRLQEPQRIRDALARVQSANVDFGDAYLAATAFETHTGVASFDHDLEKFSDITHLKL